MRKNVCIVDSNKDASLPGHGTNISLQKQVTAMGKCTPVVKKDNEERGSGINIQNHTEKVVQQMTIPSSPERIKKTEERIGQHTKTLEDEHQHKQQKKELVEKVKTMVAIQYLAFNESQMPEEIIPQESNSPISGLKVDESAVSLTCKIKQLTITHVGDSNEGKAFCDKKRRTRWYQKVKVSRYSRRISCHLHLVTQTGEMQNDRIIRLKNPILKKFVIILGYQETTTKMKCILNSSLPLMMNHTKTMDHLRRKVRKVRNQILSKLIQSMLIWSHVLI